MLRRNCGSSLGVAFSIGCFSLSAVLPALSQESGFFAPSGDPEEFIQSIPSDCEYIAESSILGARSFFLFQTCHRGGGAWLQEIPNVQKIATGILFIPEQNLSNGKVASGFWCSRKASRASSSFAMTCTRSGWRETPPYR